MCRLGSAVCLLLCASTALKAPWDFDHGVTKCTYNDIKWSDTNSNRPPTGVVSHTDQQVSGEGGARPARLIRVVSHTARRVSTRVVGHTDQQVSVEWQHDLHVWSEWSVIQPGVFRPEWSAIQTSRFRSSGSTTSTSDQSGQPYSTACFDPSGRP